MYNVCLLVKNKLKRVFKEEQFSVHNIYLEGVNPDPEKEIWGDKEMLLCAVVRWLAIDILSLNLSLKYFYCILFIY